MKHPAAYPELPPANNVDLKAVHTHRVPQQSPQWTFETGVEIRASYRFWVILVVIAMSGIYVFNRIHLLQKQNELLQSQLDSVQTTVHELLLRVSETPNDLGNSETSEDYDELQSSSSVRRKRSPNTTEIVDSGAFSHENLTSKIRDARKIRERERGKRSKLRDKVMNLRQKLKIANFRRRAAIADLSTVKLSPRTCEARAVYLVPTGNNVNIESRQQLIGPWYVASDGEEYGFNDLWYRDIALDANGTSIIFQERGLHLIYAQVFYHLTLGPREKPAPMGYRIYIRKNPSSPKQIFQRPIPIAECVPSYPATYYQTCFTQVAWFMDKGDQIYLEHFTKALPMIEADKQGKTFLGIVRLSGPN